ncbi:uncharacterized protein DEA37_0012691 [Paragonimus westermani]|uniref:Uncharacterized protein n=1 Tax=Paragonimus westermani TaxID=34504 RepID=A0A5J4N844_9TREM|nr:uncharacterized protein DEA37_0012691 [Paragonimus westermani]
MTIVVEPDKFPIHVRWIYSLIFVSIFFFFLSSCLLGSVLYIHCCQIVRSNVSNNQKLGPMGIDVSAVVQRGKRAVVAVILDRMTKVLTQIDDRISRVQQQLYNHMMQTNVTSKRMDRTLSTCCTFKR